MAFRYREELVKALQISRCSPEELSDEQRVIVDRFWALRERLAADESSGAAAWPPGDLGGLSPADECVRLPSETQSLLIGGTLGKLPVEALSLIAAVVGPLSLSALRTASRSHSRAFDLRCFVPTGRAPNRKRRGEEFGEDMVDRPDLDDEDDFFTALEFEERFERLQPSCLDDLLLVLRRHVREDAEEYRARLGEHFTGGFVHEGGPESMGKLAKRCWLSPCVAQSVFPNRVYYPPCEFFFPRPLHVAVLARNMPAAKLLLRGARECGCSMDTLLYRDHAATTNFAVMTPLLLAVLTVPDASWEPWATLLVEAGASFSAFDADIVRLIAQHEQITPGEEEALADRLARASGRQAGALEALLAEIELPAAFEGVGPAGE